MVDIRQSNWELSVFESELPAQSILVLAQIGDKWLFVRNKFRGWELTGGHIEPGESLQQTAAREVWEEGGCDIAEVELFATYRLASGHVTHVGFAKITNVGTFVPDLETSERAFLSEVPQGLSFPDGLYEQLFLMWESRQSDFPPHPLPQHHS